MIVWATKKDIARIEKLGFAKEFFVEKDAFLGPNAYVLKKKNDGSECVFLKSGKDGAYSCGIYADRPEVCRQYPFFGQPLEDCKPASFLKSLKLLGSKDTPNVKIVR